jgi:hypothetical protein
MLIAGPLIIMSLFWWKGLHLTAKEFNPANFFAAFTAVSIIMYNGAVLHPHAGISKTLSKLPVSTGFIVRWFMVSSLVTAIASNVFVLAVYRYLTGIDWPFLTTSLTLAITVLLLQSAICSMNEFRWRLLVQWTAVAVIWTTWSITRHHSAMEGGIWEFTIWRDPTLLDWSFMAILIAGAYWSAISGFTRRRRGAFPDGIFSFSNASTFDESVQAVLQRPAPEFRGSEKSFQWFTFLDNRGISIFGMGASLCMILLFQIAVLIFPGNINAGAIAAVTSVATCIFAVILGMMVGAAYKHPQRDELSTFISTKPLGDFDMARIMLRNAAKSYLKNWVILVALGFSLPVFCYAFGLDNPLSMSIQHYIQNTENSGLIALGRLALAFAVGWSIVGIAAAAGWMGRPMLTSGIILGFVVVFLAHFVGSFLLPESIGDAFAAWTIPFAEVALLAAIGLAFVQAQRRQLIRWSTTLISAVVFAIGVAVCLSIPGPQPLESRCIAAALISLPLVPFAAAPLAIAWNRHR